MMRAFLLVLLAASPACAAGRIEVFVSVLPQKYLAERIGEDRVAVAALVGPGANPHSFDPTPRQVVALSRARLYFAIGVPFEDIWLDRARAVNPDLRIVECCAVREHDHARSDPHVWTDPRNMLHQARAMRDQLIAIDPANAALYAVNHAKLERELEALDAELESILARAPSRYFLVVHPSWEHFARRYGLQQIALELHGRETGARRMVEVIEFARAQGLRTVFFDLQSSQAAARALSRALKANAVALNALAEDYPDSLRAAARAIAGAKVRS